jgi:hypothetical protein
MDVLLAGSMLKLMTLAGGEKGLTMELVAVPAVDGGE